MTNLKNENISGVIMAGGKSSRMGKDKGLLIYKSKPLIGYGIDLLQPLFERIYISTNNTEYKKFQLPIIEDTIKNCGPIGGIHAALNTIETTYALFLSCDMPLLAPSVLNKLIENLDDYEIVIPRVGKKIEPLCAIYSKFLLADIETRLNNSNYKLQDLIFNSKTKFIDFDNRNAFFNINTKEDFIK